MNKEDQRPLSRRHAVGLVGMGMAAAAAGPALPQQPGPTNTPNSSAPTMQDPRSNHPKPPFKEQTQPWPGLASKMDPRPDHGENSYRGSGRLAGRKALITGGDSGMGRAAAIAYAREGADVAINYFPSQEPDAREVIQLIKDAGRTGVSIPGDLREELSVRNSWRKPSRNSAGSILSSAMRDGSNRNPRSSISRRRTSTRP